MTERVKLLIDSYLQEKGIELVEITYKREQGGLTLRLLVDTPEGISIKECEDLSGYLSGLLDKEEMIKDRYILEVSSPGLDRPIITDRDFERSMGKELDISTFELIDLRKTHEGKLVGMDKENVVIESNGMSTVIPKNKIARARLRLEF
ncbi:MAG: ribosome maturation factor RimP [Candidatus Omnitrophota bacterium]